jgi:predicted AlkP superfamily pyrophosphatase or phosphodiesterase
MSEQRRRVLIVSFDALRPDMVTPELMPNLTAFAKRGVRFTHSRATFPTETRVNQAALVTGCYPTRHGIVGNKFLEPMASPGKLFNTGDETQLAEGDRNCITRPSSSAASAWHCTGRMPPFPPNASRR